MNAVPTSARDWCRERLDDPAEDLAIAIRFAPRPLRTALTAVSAIYVELERTATRFRELGVARAKLGWWCDELLRLDAGHPEHPATRLLAAAGVVPPIVALGDLLTGFELILLEGPVNDLATAEMRTELGYARFAFVLARLCVPPELPPSLLTPTGVALGLARLLRSPALADEARADIIRTAREELQALAPQLRALPPPLRIFAALAWRSLNGNTRNGAERQTHRSRVFTAWRAARGKMPRDLAAA